MNAQLCSNCLIRPRRPGWPRCAPCHAWYYSHARAERPPGIPVRGAGFAGPCAHCGWARGPYTSGRCRACYVYRWRTGRERPAHLCHGTRPPCRTCGGPCEPTAGRWCHACRSYQHRTGCERPAHLWGRRLVQTAVAS